MTGADAALLATIVVPLYTGLLHGAIALVRRRETSHLWLALAALSASAIAAAVVGHAGVATAAEARRWQTLELAAGCVMLVAFVRWMLAFLGLERPGIVRASWAHCGAVAAALAADLVYAHDAVLRPVAAGRAPVLELPVAPVGVALLGGFLLFAAYLGVEIARARHRSEVQPLVWGYPVFAATLAWEGARGAGVLAAPQLLPFGYLVMVVALSAVQIRHFVRSMEAAERIASDLQACVEERSEALRRKELQLVHGERLATLGTLAAGVAAEIDEPMGFVSTSLDRVGSLWSDADAAERIPAILAECRDGLGRLRTIVAELLRLARGSDAQQLPIDLASVVSSVLPLVRAEARGRAELAIDLAPVPAVSGNPGLLAQVVLQLLLNGIRAVAAEGRGPGRVEVSTAFEQGRVRLRVRDEGAPLPAEALPTLFDPFADTARSGRLGLAITHHIVRQHGGELAVASGARGTELTVELPPLD